LKSIAYGITFDGDKDLGVDVRIEMLDVEKKNECTSWNVITKYFQSTRKTCMFELLRYAWTQIFLFYFYLSL